MARSSKNIKSITKRNTVSSEFKKQVRKFMDEHSDVLRELAKK